MSVLAACGHKSEWICSKCAKCSLDCECPGELEPVHINTKEAALALARYAKEARRKMSAGPGDPTRSAAFEGGEPKEP
jgi:heterodisulfide reductase subunit C